MKELLCPCGSIKTKPAQQVMDQDVPFKMLLTNIVNQPWLFKGTDDFEPGSWVIAPLFLVWILLDTQARHTEACVAVVSTKRRGAQA